MYIKKYNIFIIILILFGIAGAFFTVYFYEKEKGITVENFTESYEDSLSLYINTPQDLVAFSEKVNQGESYVGVHVILKNDLDMQGITDFLPIGLWRGENYFCGIFDGRGHTIKNLMIDTEEGGANSGLFGTLGGTVCNLNLENIRVTGSACGAVCSIATDNHAKIYNCSVNNCIIDAPYTTVIGGQYLGINENTSIDGSGNIGKLNENLENISAKCYGIAMNEWVEQDGKAVLSPEKTKKAPDMLFHINSISYTGNITPYYREEDEIYYFILPNDKLDGSAFLSFENGEGLKEKYSVNLLENNDLEKNIFILSGDKITITEEIPPEKTSEQEKLYAVKIGFIKDTASVFIGTGKRWTMDYLKSSKNYLLPGNIEILSEKGSGNYVGSLKRIQGRGNDSWRSEKKGFNIELKDNADLLGMGAETHFALIPGFRDNSLLTYKVVQDLCKETKMEFAPEYRFVNLYIDGEYQGLYILAEKVNVGYNRINIDTTKKDITGSYLFELDSFDYQDEPNVFQTEHGNIYTIKYPLFVEEKQMEYCNQLWNDFENAVSSETGFDRGGGAIRNIWI